MEILQGCGYLADEWLPIATFCMYIAKAVFHIFLSIIFFLRRPRRMRRRRVLPEDVIDYFERKLKRLVCLFSVAETSDLC